MDIKTLEYMDKRVVKGQNILKKINDAKSRLGSLDKYFNSYGIEIYTNGVRLSGHLNKEDIKNFILTEYEKEIARLTNEFEQI